MNNQDLGSTEDGADFHTVVIDEITNTVVAPNGTLGDRHTNPKKWNLRLETVQQEKKYLLVYLSSTNVIP